MPKYTFIINMEISMNTEVEASSLDSAIEEAQSRLPISLCHQCARGEDDAEWCTSGELDGSPAEGELTCLLVDGEEVSEKQWHQALTLWGGGE